MARRARLHQQGLVGSTLRDTVPGPEREQDRQQGGRRARRGLSSHVFTDEMNATLLHHVLGLDSGERRRPAASSNAIAVMAPPELGDTAQGSVTGLRAS